MPAMDDKIHTLDPIFEIRDLRLTIPTYEGLAWVLKSVDLKVERGDILGLVGETGCGKTLSLLSALRMMEYTGAQPTAQRVVFLGQDIFHLPHNELLKLRARHIAMVFQDPETNLNPVLTVGSQMIDAILCRRGHSMVLHLGAVGHLIPNVRRKRGEAHNIAVDMLHRLGIRDPSRVMRAYPHELSGGMKQRVLIAMALSGAPKLLVADEPTTALDVSIQAQLLVLVRELVTNMGLSVVWITHNLGVVACLCNRIAVMYSGLVIEYAPKNTLFTAPRHPYTVSLLNAIPTRSKRGSLLRPAPGHLPSLISPPSGCLFHPRCSQVMSVCREMEPEEICVAPDHRVRCHLYSS